MLAGATTETTGDASQVSHRMRIGILASCFVHALSRLCRSARPPLASPHCGTTGMRYRTSAQKAKNADQPTELDGDCPAMGYLGQGLIYMLRERRMDRSFLLASFACLASHATQDELPLCMWIRSSGIESNDPMGFLSTRAVKADSQSPEWAMRPVFMRSGSIALQARSDRSLRGVSASIRALWRL